MYQKFSATDKPIKNGIVLQNLPELRGTSKRSVVIPSIKDQLTKMSPSHIQIKHTPNKNELITVRKFTFIVKMFTFGWHLWNRVINWK